MKIKLFISLICFLIAFTFSTSKANSTEGGSHKALAGSKTSVRVINYYVRVLVDGIWYIYEYAEDGSLIAIFPDEDDTHHNSSKQE